MESKQGYFLKHIVMTCLITWASLLMLLEAPRSAMATPLGSLPSSAAFVSAANPAGIPHQQRRWAQQHHISGTPHHASTSTRHTLIGSTFNTRSKHHYYHRVGQQPLQARQQTAANRTVARMMSGVPPPPLDEEQRRELINSRYSSDRDTINRN